MSRRRKGPESRSTPAPPAQQAAPASVPPQRGTLCRVLTVSLIVALAGVGTFGWWAFRRPSPAAPTAAIPDPDTREMEQPVQESFAAARQAVVQDPSSANAWGLLAKVCDAHGLYHDAEICYRRARSLAPRVFDWAYLLARVRNLQGGELDEIVALYEAASQLAPKYAPLPVRLGDVLMRYGRSAEAKDAYQKAIELDDSLALAYRGLGQSWLALGESNRAVDSLETAVKRGDESRAVYAALAQAYNRMGDPARSSEASQKSQDARQKPDLPDPILASISEADSSVATRIRRAGKLLDSGDHAQAVQELSTALKYQPDDAVIHHRLGSAYSAGARLPAALEHFRRAVELQPDVALYRVDLARHLVQTGQPAESLPHYQDAIDKEPESGKTRALYAAALAQSGQLEIAVVEFQKASKQTELQAADQLNWGAALAQLRNLDQALPHFQEAVRLDPRLPSARFNLGFTLEQLGRPAEAIEQYRAAIQLDPNHRAAERLKTLQSSNP